LAQQCKTLYTTEIDKELYLQAQRRLADSPNVHLCHGDFLQTTLPAQKPYKVFANPPFSITAEILKKLTQAANPPTEMWLVLEKGAAKRYLGKPAETVQSLLMKPRWNMKIVYYFRREDFHPCPSVNTVLVHFFRKPQADVPLLQWNQYERFVRHTLQYGLQGGKCLLSKRQVSQALRQAKCPPFDSNGLMLYVQWLCLFRCWLSLSGAAMK